MYSYSFELETRWHRHKTFLWINQEKVIIVIKWKRNRHLQHIKYWNWSEIHSNLSLRKWNWILTLNRTQSLREQTKIERKADWSRFGVIRWRRIKSDHIGSKRISSFQVHISKYFQISTWVSQFTYAYYYQSTHKNENVNQCTRVSVMNEQKEKR